MQQYVITSNNNLESIKELFRVICIIAEQSGVKDIAAICHYLEKITDNDTARELLASKMIMWCEEFIEPILSHSIDTDKLKNEVFVTSFSILSLEQKQEMLKKMFEEEKYELIEVLKQNKLL